MKEIGLYITEKLKLNRDSGIKISEYANIICEILDISDEKITDAISEWVDDYSKEFMYLYAFYADTKYKWNEKVEYDNIKLIRMSESTIRFAKDTADISEVIYKSDKHEKSVDNIAEIRIQGNDMIVFFESGGWHPVIFEKKM